MVVDGLYALGQFLELDREPFFVKGLVKCALIMLLRWELFGHMPCNCLQDIHGSI